MTAVWQEDIFGYMQMPRYPGGNLAQWMAIRPVEGGRDPHEVLRLVEDLLRALAFLHSKGKVHCDVKPENIFLTDGGRIVVGDFDGVKEVEDEGEPPRQQQRMETLPPITVRYVAPEMLSGRRLITACDI
uniref:Protein kinase domain-containing protein n=1 Tax=Chromera velia CCMP2878 TaxID=1169474 RepID=A0A0G4H8R4_9ALVE|eukprot:Cvel_25254.t1-p1 / transcript=Cvel_25254.t1 / gene=Cvel_25254 / organism=Chromera_velia_CCMP2878 / gene_product=Interferon-induced, double-stranded RNA-activated, putative / transcript_product=Interferon-induced, double-stranded RNA-activated, putative / location=Cvel_scaffold2834:11946-12332(+) / protein_length=129 / sequence_SO=supercontig / SO=protein_coding / is_pseudo=false